MFYFSLSLSLSRWLSLSYPSPSSPLPPLPNSLQSEVYKIFVIPESCADLPAALASKLKITLGLDLCVGLDFSHGWFDNISNMLARVKIHTAMCVCVQVISVTTPSSPGPMQRAHGQNVP